MKYLILLLSIVLFSCDSAAKVKKEMGNLKDTIVSKDSFNLTYLVNKYGEVNVFTAFYFIDKNSINTDTIKLDSSSFFYCQIHAILSKINNKTGLLKTINNYLQKLPLENREQLLNNLTQWLRNEVLLTSALDANLSNQVFFEEIIYDIPETKHYVTQYLKNPNQYWGSLSENQACKLYYDISLYLLKLNASSRLKFFCEYFDVACKIAISPTAPQ